VKAVIVKCFIAPITPFIHFFGDSIMQQECQNCAYIYDPEVGDSEGGIDPGTPFEEIAEDWVCPVCGAAKSQFEPLEG
jgi:rubredoxin